MESNPMSSSFTPQLSGVSRLRSSSIKKLPEPLRRAVADCLSSPIASANEPSRILRDYLKGPMTTDMAYSAILEHTIAERERSPAVVARCVALLKRYLLRYKPSEETLLQIDRFCSAVIAECVINPNQPWSQSMNRQSGASTNPSPLLVSSVASEAHVKSLSYVRSLVARHIPKRIFQPASSSGKSLPTLSSLLSKSFNSQRSPAIVPETPSSSSVPKSLQEDSITRTVSKSLKREKVDEKNELGFIAHDVLKWRWLEQPQSSSVGTESVRGQYMTSHSSFLEVGAAALLVGDIESKMKGQPWKFFGTDDMPYLDQLLQSSPVTPITNSVSARCHLRAITASKRKKAGSRHIWEDSPVITFRPRARQLFQYRHYSEQQPLRLNPAEVQEVIAAVCSEASSPGTNVMTVSTRLGNNSGKPSTDVAVSVLIKLVIDMYVLDSQTAAPLILSMLEEILSSSETGCRIRAFDLILNLGVHSHLLEPMIVDDASIIEEEYSQESYYDSHTQIMMQGSRKGSSQNKSDTVSAIDNFEPWIINILYEILLLLVQTEEKEESVWASALSCLLYFVCDRGKIKRNRLQGLDIRVLKELIRTSRENSWAELVHCKLISMLTNMFYEVLDEVTEPVPRKPKFLVDQLDLIGGGFKPIVEKESQKHSHSTPNSKPMSPPQNQPEHHQSDAEPSDPSLNQPASDSSEPELAGGEQEEEEGECGFCLFMKGGGCKDTFVDWENCVKEAEDKNEDLVEKCSQVTANLKQCMDSHSDYYEPILRAEKHAEEQVAIQLEKEKQDSEASNNQQEAPSQSNQNDHELELNATPTPPKQDEKEQSNSEAEKRSPDQPASEAPKAEDKEKEEEEEEGECGFCVFMKGGGCRDTFVDWENCVMEAEENKEDIVEKCSQVTSLLKLCMDSHSDYYAPILVAEKQIEEQAVIELEKEKLDSATSNNEQEAPSHSNQK